jgi:cold shock CspA family protein
LNARQKRLFEESLKKNPGMKMPTEVVRSSELTDDDLALLKQGVGDKTSRPASASAPQQGGNPNDPPPDQFGSIVTYFEEKGFGFLRPEAGGRDVFFHISRLVEAQAADLTPGTRVIFELGMDRTGKMAASMVRLAPPAPKEAPAAKEVAKPDVPPEKAPEAEATNP